MFKMIYIHSIASYIRWNEVKEERKKTEKKKLKFPSITWCERVVGSDDDDDGGSGGGGHSIVRVIALC